MYLLDTNSIINFLDASMPKPGMELLNEIVDDDPYISVITKIEVLGFNFRTEEEQDITETFIEGTTVLVIDDEIVEKTINLRKKIKIALPDAIIAATALAHDFTLVTRNTKDFKNIEGLEIMNPFEQ